MFPVEKKIATIVALKIAFASLLSILIAYGMGWSHKADFVFFAPFSVCINMLMFPFQSPSNKMMIERLAGVFVGYLFATAYILCFPGQPEWGLVYSGILTFVCCYFIGCNTKYNYALILFFIILNLILIFNYIAPEMTSSSWQLPACTFVALISLYVVDFFFPKGQIRKALLTHRKTLFNHLLFHLDQDYADTSHLFIYDEYQVELEKFKTHLNKDEATRLQFINNQLKQIHHSINLIHQQIKQQPNFHLSLQFELVAIKNKINEGVQYLRDEKIFNFTEAETLINLLKHKEHQISHKTDSIYIHKLIYEFSVILLVMKKLQNPEKNKINATPEAESSSYYQTLNFAAVKFSFKITVSVVITTLLLKLLHIPGLPQAVIACIVFVITPNINELFYKALMRLSGIIVGGVVGILIGELCYILHSMSLLFLLFFVIIFFVARLGLIYRQYEYAAIQGCLIFVIVLFTGGYGHITLELGYERFIGLFCGMAIASAISFLLNPKLPTTLIYETVMLACNGIQKQLGLLNKASDEAHYFIHTNKKTAKQLDLAKDFQFRQSHIVLGYKKENNQMLAILIQMNHALDVLFLNIDELNVNKKTNKMTVNLYNYFCATIPWIQLRLQSKGKSSQQKIFHDQKHLLQLIKSDFNIMKEKIKYTPPAVKCIACLSVIIATMEELTLLK